MKFVRLAPAVETLNENDCTTTREAKESLPKNVSRKPYVVWLAPSCCGRSLISRSLSAGNRTSNRTVLSSTPRKGRTWLGPSACPWQWEYPDSGSRREWWRAVLWRPVNWARQRSSNRPGSEGEQWWGLVDEEPLNGVSLWVEDCRSRAKAERLGTFKVIFPLPVDAKEGPVGGTDRADAECRLDVDFR